MGRLAGVASNHRSLGRFSMAGDEAGRRTTRGNRTRKQEA